MQAVNLPASIKEKEIRWPKEPSLSPKITSEDLEGDKLPPAPDQDPESN